MADEFKIVASLNIPESASRINKDIPKLEGQAKHLKIVADLNPTLSIKNIQATLNKMNNNANIKIGIDTSGLNSVQGATQNITNGLKSVQIQAQQTASAVERTLTTISADNISDKMVKEFQSSFGIMGKKASETNAIFKDLFVTLNNAWYAGDIEKYNSTLTKIYNTTINNISVSKKLSKEAQELQNVYRSQITDGSKVFIDPSVKSELEYILGTSKNIQSVLSTVFGVGKWSTKSGIPVDGLIADNKTIQGIANEIVGAYNRIKDAQIQSFNPMDNERNGTELIEEQVQSLLKLKTGYVDLEGIRHDFVKGLGWFESIGEETKDIETETNAIEKQTKATEKLKAIRESITRDTNGQQISRTSMYGDTGFTRTSYYNEKDELTSYTDTENYKQLEQVANQIEETRAKYNRLLADFKSSNSAIQSGLTQPIQQFKTVLNGLGKTSSINDVKNSFELLKQSASDITQYLETTNSAFNKATNAVNHYKDMDNILKEITASFDKLSTKPSNLKSEIDGAKKKLLELQNIEKQEGTNVNWAKKYREVNLELVQLRTNIKLAERASKDDDKANNDLRIEFVQKLNNAYKQLISYKNKLASTTNTDSQKAYADEIIKTEKIIDNLIQQLRSGKLITAEIQSQIDLMNEQVALTDRINRNKISDARGKQAVQTFEQQAKQLKDYASQIDNAIKLLNTLQNSTTFRNNASNSQVIAEKNNISALITKYQNLKTQLNGNITSAGLENVGNKLTQLNAQFNDATTTAKRFETELRSDNGAEQLAQKVKLLNERIKAYQSANPKAAKAFSQEFSDMSKTLSNPNIDLSSYNSVAKQLQIIKVRANEANLAGKTMWATFKEKLAKFTGWMSMTAAISMFTRSIRDALDELKEVDTILTEISKTSDRTEESLRKLGETSFATASKYGQKASDYLLGVQEMSRAGFDENSSEQMAELSTLAQSAGDMTAELANEYLIATNAGYQFGGSAEKLNAVLNSQNYITNRNALNMSELAEATKIVASQAAQSGIGIDEMTAAVGTMIATTQQGGEVAARALKGKRTLCTIALYGCESIVA